MGNSNGGLADYYAAFDRHDALQGGFIWEWIDHGIRVGDPLGLRRRLRRGPARRQLLRRRAGLARPHTASRDVRAQVPGRAAGRRAPRRRALPDPQPEPLHRPVAPARRVGGRRAADERRVRARGRRSRARHDALLRRRSRGRVAAVRAAGAAGARRPSRRPRLDGSAGRARRPAPAALASADRQRRPAAPPGPQRRAAEALARAGARPGSIRPPPAGGPPPRGRRSAVRARGRGSRGPAADRRRLHARARARAARVLRPRAVGELPRPPGLGRRGALAGDGDRRVRALHRAAGARPPRRRAPAAAHTGGRQRDRGPRHAGDRLLGQPLHGAGPDRRAAHERPRRRAPR